MVMYDNEVETKEKGKITRDIGVYLFEEGRMLRLAVFNDASEMSRVFVVNTGVQQQEIYFI